MKHIIIITLLSVIALLSCSKKEKECNTCSNKEIKLNFKTSSMKEDEITYQSKALNISDDIKNINLYITDKQNNLVYSSYSLGSCIPTAYLSVSSGSSYDIYAIANMEKEVTVANKMELENLYYASSITSSDGAIAMSVAKKEMILQDEQTISLEFIRAISKIGYKFDYSRLNPGITIDIKEVRLRNVPNKVYLFKDSKAMSTSDIISHGDSRQGYELNSLSQYLYLFENKQGSNLLPGNTNQQKKYFSSTNPLSKLCTYLEVIADYHSSEKNGEIIYRFYLGRDEFTDFNIVRNTKYTNIISFIGKGGTDEVGWRIVVDDLKDYVTDIILSPSFLTFNSLYTDKQITATVIPFSANNKALSWSSSNNSVASVNSSGLVTSLSEGTAVITARSTDGSNISATCDVTVIEPTIEIPTTANMYKGEYKVLSVSNLYPNEPSKIRWSSSDNNIATVSSSGEIKALALGNVTITAEYYGKKALCQISIGEAYVGNLNNIALLTKASYSDAVTYSDIAKSHNLTEYLATNAKVEYKLNVIGQSYPHKGEIMLNNSMLSANDYSDYRNFNRYFVTAIVKNNKNEEIDTINSDEIKVYYEFNCYVSQDFEIKDEHNNVITYGVTTTFQQSIPKNKYLEPVFYEYPIYPNDEYVTNEKEYKQGTIIYSPTNIKVGGENYTPNSKIEYGRIWVYFISVPPPDHLPDW